MSVDPLIQSPTSTQSVNPYSYIMNNPLAGTDPTGYACEAATGSHICKSEVKATVTQEGSTVKVHLTGGTAKQQQAVVNAIANGASKMQSATSTNVANVGSLGENAKQGSGNIGITGEVRPIQGSPAIGFLKSTVRDATFGIIYGDTSSIPSLHPAPEDSADMQAYEELAGAEKYAMAFLPSKGGKAVVELGQSQLKAIRTINNIAANGLKDKDFIGVGTEMMQSLKSKLGDKYWNHIKEMNDNLRGLRKSIKTLEKVDNPQANEARLKAVDAIDKMEGAFKGHGI